MDHRRDTLEDHFTTFSTNLIAAGGIALRVESALDAVATIGEIVGDGAHQILWTSSRMIDEQPEIAEALGDAGFELCIPNDPAQVRDQPVGLTSARTAIAETGSLLLDEPNVADRSVSLMTILLIVICSLDALVPSLDEAAGVLRTIATDGPSYATFVTGPSRTADIERQLTIGVQGPAAMHVIFVP